MNTDFDFVVVEWMVSGVLFRSHDIKKCYEFMKSFDDDRDLVILFGEEDIFWDT